MSMKKRNPTPREINDFYRTPYHCTDSLLRVESFDGPIWEPACGDGEISEVLKAAGHDVASTDLIDRGCGVGGIDFLASRGPEPELPVPAIVTNPPYKFAKEFILHALELGSPKVCMFLRLAFLEGGRRYQTLFRDNPPTRIYVLSNRPTLWHGDDAGARDSGGAIPYMWAVWCPGEPREPVQWLQRQPNISLALASLERSVARLTKLIEEQSNGR